jgi:GrpB-like predicted nucleotidyltransferase (UPF0157 family)
VYVIPYRDEWPALFREERDRILRALGTTAVALHHIGSTAVPGHAAKPIVDMLLEVTALADLDAQAGALERFGYEPKGEFGLPGRRYFRRDDERGIRTHHLHAYAAGSADVERHLAFRDYLVAHRAAAADYGALKRDLAARHPDDSRAYSAAKDAFVREHQRRALDWRATRTIDAST